MEPEGEIAGSSVALSDTNSKSLRTLARLAHCTDTDPPLDDPVHIAAAQSYQMVDFDDTIISATVSVGLEDDDVPSSDGSVEDKRKARHGAEEPAVRGSGETDGGPAFKDQVCDDVPSYDGSVEDKRKARHGAEEPAVRGSGETDGGPAFKDQVRSVAAGDQARPPARLPQPKLKQQQHGDKKVQGGGPDYKDQAREVVPQPDAEAATAWR